MPRIISLLLTCSFLYLYFYCTGTYCQLFTPPSSCMKPHWFQCHNGQCIPYTFECDGEQDCLDGSDEQYCSGFTFRNPFPLECAVDEYKCDNNDCIPLGKFCDTMIDCVDESDEYSNCTEKLTCISRCHDGHCMRETWRCDGVKDCSDGSDEIDCDNATTSASKCKLENDLFLCPNQRCISLLKTCDGEDNCGDGHDENGSCSNGKALCLSANCDHNCRQTPQGAVCVCRPGYKLLNNHTCIDIDECETYGICDHHCVNTAGSYSCYCENDYTLQEDERTCKADGGEATLIFSSKMEIRGIHLDSQIYFSVVKNLNNSHSVAIDGDYIYWSQSTHGNQMIMKMLMGIEDKKENVVRMGLQKVSGIAIDWVTGNIYFADELYMRIGVCNNNGLFCTILIKEEDSNPRSITLLPHTGMMYWCDWGLKPHIAQAEMDGQNMSLLVTNVEWPNSVSVDYPNSRLYWVDIKLMLVESIHLDGTDRKVILQDMIKHPFSIAVFENKLYWTDWETQYTIQYCDKFSGKNWMTLVRIGDAPLDIYIDHSAIKPKFKNPCKSNPCSDLCLLKRNRSYTCACTMDRKLSSDNHTCQDVQNNHVILFTDKMIVEYYNELIGTPKIHFFEHWYRISAVAYNTLTGTLLLSDQLSNYIMCYDPANSEKGIYRFIQLDAKDVVTGMAYDYIGNNLYISYAMSKIIEVINLKSLNKTVFNFNEEPHNILLVPEEGMMFVVFVKQQEYYVTRLQMDSTSSDKSLVRMQFRNKTTHMGPISLCYDANRKLVYLTDQVSGLIWAITIKDLKIYFHHSGIKEPTNLVSAGRYLYWSEFKSSVLFWVRKSGLLIENQFDLHDLGINDTISHLVSLRNVSIRGQYDCQNNNGNCSHLCLTTSAITFVCACPPGMTLAADKHTCTSTLKCPENKIQCEDHNICIDRKKWCDGIKDCPFNEDEPIGCKALESCGKEQFMCEDGSCINSTSHCNWHFDCADKSDEKNCFGLKKCASDEFLCNNGECIHTFLVCNGKFDCSDFSDETNCRNNTCPKDFTCKETRQCIPIKWRCDGENDCEDGSDEEECEQEKCTDEHFMCANGLCISSSLQCDGVDDCNDNSDEENCGNGRKSYSGNCSDDEYPCINTNICISKHLRCNGIQDCPKNDDEHHCASCLTNEFVCNNKKCISQIRVCDKINDCGDNSDEEDCDNHHTLQLDIKFNATIKCDEFQCSSTGMCLPYSKVCDSSKDCLDGSDEQGKCSIACVRDNDCEELCFKTPQGRVCGCNEGYRLDTDGKSCIDINECENMTCSQLCENTKGSYKCLCYEGYILRSDGISCKATGTSMEIFTAVGNNIRKISLNLHSISVINVMSNVEITGIDVNAINDFIYWSNGELGTISQMNLETHDISTIVDNSYPTKLAVDWITNNIYFIDKFYPNGIRVCNLEKMKCAQVTQRKHNMQVTSLLVDPINRWLYWSETDRETYKTGHIFRAYMKGTHIQMIISENVGNVDGIAIDYLKSRLYWLDVVNKTIESSTLNGTERHKFLQIDRNPLNIGIFENTLYLLTDARGQIMKCPLYGERTCEMLNVGRNNIYKHFAIMHISRNPYVENFCEKENCDHMCILDTNKAVCMCENGQLIEPNDICVTKGRAIVASSIDDKSRNVQHRPGGYTTVMITLSIIVLILGGIGYCYYQKNKFRTNSNSEFSSFSSIRFQNPSYDHADEVALTFDRPNSTLAPGEHEYVNPIDDKVIKAAEECSIEKLRRTSEQMEQQMETEVKQDTLISFAWQK